MNKNEETDENISDIQVLRRIKVLSFIQEDVRPPNTARV